MTCIGIIGGSGFYQFPELEEQRLISVETPFGAIDGAIIEGRLSGHTVYFLPRHGAKHNTPPHSINYRANIQALHQLGVTRIYAVNAAGGIRDDMAPGALVLPDQVVDYTYGREHTFFDGFGDTMAHIDFSEPFNLKLHETFLQAAAALGQPLIHGGTYGCTQGPRLETPAEIRRLKQDGCDLVGMTVMPEAALAKEREMDYMSISIIANWGAGIDQASITVESILAVLDRSVLKIREVILKTISLS